MKGNSYDIILYNIKTGKIKTIYFSIPNIVIAWVVAQYAMNFDRKDDEFVLISAGNNVGIDKEHSLYSYSKHMAKRYRDSEFVEIFKK